MRRSVKNLRAAASVMAAIATIFSGTATAQLASPVEVETSTFGQDSFAIGTLNQTTGALPRDLWRGSDAATVGFLLDTLPNSFSEPALVEALKRTLLSPGDSPAGATSDLTGKKLMVLARAGFYEEAASLAELAGGLNAEPVLSQAIAFRELMQGQTGNACRRNADLTKGRDLPFWVKLRVLCYAINGEDSAADLTLGLMREQGLMTGQDEKLFNALVTDTKIKQKLMPQNAFQYAIVREQQLELDIAQLDQADGAVLKALVFEVNAPPQARIYAAERALYFGIISRDDVLALFQSFEFTPERKAEAKGLMVKSPNNYGIDALVYQVVEDMALPELAFDRSQLVGEVLRKAGSYQRFKALAEIYAPIAMQFEAIENYTPYAKEFALAGIVTGNPTLAQKWVGTMASAPEKVEDVEELLNLYALKDRSQAQNLAAYTGITLDRPNVPQLAIIGSSRGGDPARLAKVLNMGFEAVSEKRTGQGALVALASAGLSTDSNLNTVRKVMMIQNLYAAGMEDIIAGLAFTPKADKLVSDMASTLANGNVTGGDVTVGDAGRAGDVSTASNIATPRVKPAR